MLAIFLSTHGGIIEQIESCTHLHRKNKCNAFGCSRADFSTWIGPDGAAARFAGRVGIFAGSGAMASLAWPCFCCHLTSFEVISSFLPVIVGTELVVDENPCRDARRRSEKVSAPCAHVPRQESNERPAVSLQSRQKSWTVRLAEPIESDVAGVALRSSRKGRVNCVFGK